MFLTEGDLVDDRWLVDEILGMGGAGITYRCFDQATGEDVALKYLHPDRRSGVLAHRLAIEGEVLELLNHPHIVPFRALKVGGTGPCYLATAHQSGGSLEAWIRRDGPLSPRAVLAVGRQLALALEYVHAGGIVHRDLKPGNVLIEERDPEAPVVRLADFGIARIYKSARAEMSITRTGAFIGTPEYAAPEQIRGEKGIGPAADAFALGALLHYCASGRALLSRRSILDWDAFRAREWKPSDRPRLTSLAETADDITFLALLDRVIDSLMSESPSARMEMADAALALGAMHDELAPENQAPLHPPTLVSLHEDWSDLDEPQEVDALEALVPSIEVPTVRDELDETVPNLAAIVPAPSEPAPRPSLSPASEGRGADDVEWPPPAVRRRRRTVRLALLAAVLVVGLLAWPGGLAALVGPEGMAMLPPPMQRLVAAVSPSDVDAETLDALDTLDERPVLTSSTDEVTQALASPAPLKLIEEEKVPKRRGLRPPLPLPKPALLARKPLKVTGDKPTGRKAVDQRAGRTRAKRGTSYSSPTRTAAPVPAPERDRPDGMTDATRIETLPDEGLALLRDDGAALSGRIERERREADERARRRVEEASAEAARIARVQRRIDRVLAEVEASRSRAHRHDDSSCSH